MTPEEMAFVSGLAGSLLSLVFNWLPGLRQRFDKLSSANQQLSMAVMTFVIAVGINIYQCLDPESLTCTDGFSVRRVGILAATFLAGAVSNQSTDRITPKPKEVRKRRAKRVVASRSNLTPTQKP